MDKVKFSLILCTVGTTKFLNEFFVSLSNQSFKNFEVIVVDQNIDDRVDIIVKEFLSLMNIKHIKSEVGLSKARNKGLQYAGGEIIAFPDDDCIYPIDLLKNVNEYMKKNQKDFLLIKMKNSYKNGRKVQEGIKSQEVNYSNMFVLGASISIFLKREIMIELKAFDENLGLGAKTIFQSVEDIDLIARAIKKNIIVYFENTIEVYHPFDDEKIDKDKNLDERSFKGGAAEMYLLNKIECGTFFKLKRIIRRVMIIFYYLLKGNFYKMRLSYKILQGNCKYFFMNINFIGENK